MLHGASADSACWACLQHISAVCRIAFSEASQGHFEWKKHQVAWKLSYKLRVKTTFNCFLNFFCFDYSRLSCCLNIIFNVTQNCSGFRSCPSNQTGNFFSVVSDGIPFYSSDPDGVWPAKSSCAVGKNIKLSVLYVKMIQSHEGRVSVGMVWTGGHKWHRKTEQFTLECALLYV